MTDDEEYEARRWLAERDVVLKTMAETAKRADNTATAYGHLYAENAHLRAVANAARAVVIESAHFSVMAPDGTRAVETLRAALAALDSQETGSRGSGTADSVLTDEGGEG